MSTQNMVVILVGMALAVIGGLLWLAMAGNVWAAGILFSGWSILCLLLGWGLSIAQQRSAAAREQAAFTSNMKENLALMGAMATAQNRQSAGLMQQLNQAARLPQVGAGADALLIDSAIFDELESGS